MVTSSPAEPAAVPSGKPDTADYFNTLRADVDPFVARHFGLLGTLRLHRHALGWDILRAPVNVVLSLLLVLTRVVAYLLRLIGLRRVGAWLASRRIVLRTSVARQVETCIVTHLLRVPLRTADATRDHAALEHAILAAPQFREMLRSCENAEEAQASSRRVLRAISEYSGIRSAVSEITTVICVLMIGAFVFQAFKPGMISMAPSVAELMVRATAIADFPFGQTMGGLWYGVFAPDAPRWLVAVTIAGLVMIGSVVAAFAGIAADPLQSRLGIHRRRLLRLINTIEDELTGAGDKPFAAREHYYARLLDLWDAGASLLRAFRS